MLNRLIWGSLLALIAVMGQQFYDKLIKGRGTLTVITEDLPENTVKLHWEGPIKEPMPQLIYQAYKKWGRKKEKFILSLNSGGGIIFVGEKVIAVLRKIKKSNLLVTEVGASDHCLSMCVPIYLQGQIRHASRYSRWLFHEPKKHNLDSRDKSDITQRQKDVLTKHIVRRYYKPARLNESWVADMEQKIKKGDYWRTGKQLVNEKSGIIHKLHEGISYY